MTAIQLVEVTSAALAISAVIFSAGRFTESIKANTRVTEKLSDVIDKHLSWSAQVVKEHDERFHEHDIRITNLEGMWK